MTKKFTLKRVTSKPILVLPKGRLIKNIIDVFAAANVEIPTNSRCYMLNNLFDDCSIFFAKPSDIPLLLKNNMCDYAFVGNDIFTNASGDMYKNVKEIFDTRLNEVRVVSAKSPGTDFKSLKRNVICATGYENIAHEYAKSNNIDVSVFKTTGATEGYISMGVDFIVDVVESGETLRRNNLVIEDVIMSSTTRIYKNVETNAKMPVILKKFIDFLGFINELDFRVSLLSKTVPGDDKFAHSDIDNCLYQDLMLALTTGIGLNKHLKDYYFETLQRYIPARDILNKYCKVLCSKVFTLLCDVSDIDMLTNNKNKIDWALLINMLQDPDSFATMKKYKRDPGKFVNDNLHFIMKEAPEYLSETFVSKYISLHDLESIRKYKDKLNWGIIANRINDSSNYPLLFEFYDKILACGNIKQSKKYLFAPIVNNIYRNKKSPNFFNDKAFYSKKYKQHIYTSFDDIRYYLSIVTEKGSMCVHSFTKSKSGPTMSVVKRLMSDMEFISVKHDKKEEIKKRIKTLLKYQTLRYNTTNDKDPELQYFYLSFRNEKDLDFYEKYVKMHEAGEI